MVVQRHAGWRIKKKGLELPELESLQTAASRTDRALEYKKSTGGEVRTLQEALTKAGFPVTTTGVYDRGTVVAVSAFQRAHGIPYPSGLQAGPKTLSTLDDHLSGKTVPPKPDKRCDYERGERDASLTSEGRADLSGGLGNELRLYDFGAGQHRLKRRHLEAIEAFIGKWNLADPCQVAWEVEVVKGFTDPIDHEADNSYLRQERAFTVSDYLKTHGVPDAPNGIPGGRSSVCSRWGRTRDRAVEIKLKRPDPPLPPKCKDAPPKPPPIPRPECHAIRTRSWGLKGVAQAGCGGKGGSITHLTLMLFARDDRIGHQLGTRFITFRGGGFGLSPVPFPCSGSVSGLGRSEEAKFRTTRPVAFEDFTGWGAVADIGAAAGPGYQGMGAKLAGPTEEWYINLTGGQIGFGAGMEAVVGRWKVTGGCI